MALAGRWQLALALLACLAVLSAAGQGLRLPPDLPPGSSSLYADFLAELEGAVAFKAAYKQHPGGACAPTGTPCSPGFGGKQAGLNTAQLNIATSPVAYDARAATRAVSKPQDQGDCDTSAAFAVVAGAEAAVASVTGVYGNSISLSELDLYYCSSPAGIGEQPLTCRSGGWLGSMLAQLQARRLQTRYCMPYGTFSSAADACSTRDCSSVDVTSSQGSFSSAPVTQLWRAQRHIRQFGGIVTRFDIHDDFRPFFVSPDNAQKVYSPRKDAKFVASHAVLVVGYNNKERFWLVKNSYGPSWGDQGFFKVAMGVCNVMDQASTFGITWSSSILKAKPLNVLPVPGRPSCFLYKAQVGDFISKLAIHFDVPIGEFLAENTGIVKDLDETLHGQRLVVCKPRQGTFKAPEAKAATDLVDSQLGSLMQLKSAVDKAGEALTDWSWQSGSNSGFCQWRGVTCDTAQTVVLELDLSIRALPQGLRGTLPPGAFLKGLPGLRLFNISGHSRQGVSSGITGPLQADWARLQELRAVHLAGNSLTGQLPEAWSAWDKLLVLNLENNKLKGPLPASWAGMHSLERLLLAGNALEGAVPASWPSGMQRLTEVTLARNRQLQGCSQRLLLPGQRMGPGVSSATASHDRGRFWCKTSCKRRC